MELDVGHNSLHVMSSIVKKMMISENTLWNFERAPTYPCTLDFK